MLRNAQAEIGFYENFKEMIDFGDRVEGLVDERD